MQISFDLQNEDLEFQCHIQIYIFQYEVVSSYKEMEKNILIILRLSGKTMCLTS